MVFGIRRYLREHLTKGAQYSSARLAEVAVISPLASKTYARFHSSSSRSPPTPSSHQAFIDAPPNTIKPSSFAPPDPEYLPPPYQATWEPYNPDPAPLSVLIERHGRWKTAFRMVIAEQHACNLFLFNGGITVLVPEVQGVLKTNLMKHFDALSGVVDRIPSYPFLPLKWSAKFILGSVAGLAGLGIDATEWGFNYLLDKAMKSEEFEGIGRGLAITGMVGALCATYGAATFLSVWTLGDEAAIKIQGLAEGPNDHKTTSPKFRKVARDTEILTTRAQPTLFKTEDIEQESIAEIREDNLNDTIEVVELTGPVDNAAQVQYEVEEPQSEVDEPTDTQSSYDSDSIEIVELDEAVSIHTVKGEEIPLEAPKIEEPTEDDCADEPLLSDGDASITTIDSEYYSPSSTSADAFSESEHLLIPIPPESSVAFEPSQEVEYELASSEIDLSQLSVDLDFYEGPSCGSSMVDWGEEIDAYTGKAFVESDNEVSFDDGKIRKDALLMVCQLKSDEAVAIDDCVNEVRNDGANQGQRRSEIGYEYEMDKNNGRRLEALVPDVKLDLASYVVDYNSTLVSDTNCLRESKSSPAILAMRELIDEDPATVIEPIQYSVVMENEDAPSALDEVSALLVTSAVESVLSEEGPTLENEMPVVKIETPAISRLIASAPAFLPRALQSPEKITLKPAFQFNPQTAPTFVPRQATRSLPPPPPRVHLRPPVSSIIIPSSSLPSPSLTQLSSFLSLHHHPSPSFQPRSLPSALLPKPKAVPPPSPCKVILERVDFTQCYVDGTAEKLREQGPLSFWSPPPPKPSDLLDGSPEKKKRRRRRRHRKSKKAEAGEMAMVGVWA